MRQEGARVQPGRTAPRRRRGAPAGAAPSVGPWREGPYVVAASGRPWPTRCVKCNAPVSTEPYRISVRVAESWTYLTILLGVLPYLFFRVIMPPRRAVLPIHLCVPHARVANGWILGTPLLAVAGAAIGMAAASRTDNGWFLWIGALSVGVAFLRPRGPVYPREIDGNRVVLDGAGEPFVASLAELDDEADLRFVREVDRLAD